VLSCLNCDMKNPANNALHFKLSPSPVSLSWISSFCPVSLPFVYLVFVVGSIDIYMILSTIIVCQPKPLVKSTFPPSEYTYFEECSTPSKSIECFILRSKLLQRLFHLGHRYSLTKGQGPILSSTQYDE
jgi:hypothetical protein